VGAIHELPQHHRSPDFWHCFCIFVGQTAML
jgi:hypothetical protein